MRKFFFICLTVLMPYTANAKQFNYDFSVLAHSLYGYSDYSDNSSHKYKHHHTPSVLEISSGISHDIGEGNIRLGADFQISGGRELEDYNQGKWGENIYISYNSFLGELSVGQIYNAAYQLAVGAPSVGIFRVNNSLITDFIANPNWQRNNRFSSFRTANSTYLNTDADSFKFSYTTPDFYNSKFAISFAPDSYSQAGLINKESRYNNKYSLAMGLYNYTQFKNVEFESSLGYAYNHKNNQEISAGLSIYYKGWTLGGSYRKNFTTSNDYDLNIRENNLPYYFDGYRKSQAFNVGLSYEFGPLTTGISYFASYADGADNKDEIISLANRLAFHKNIAVYLTAAYARYVGSDEYSDNNKGVAFITGLELSF